MKNIKIKKLVMMMLAVVFVITSCIALSLTSSAAKTDEGFSYTISREAVTITGYTGEETEIIIPSEIEGYPVTAIADNAFIADNDIESFVISDNVEKIGRLSICGCLNLKSLHIGAGLKSLGKNSLQLFPSLEKITVSEENKIFKCVNNCLIKRDTIYLGCKNSTIPDDLSITSIASYAFSNIYDLTEAIIPDNITSIGTCAFSECISLKRIYIPWSVSEIHDKAFFRCNNIESIEVDILNPEYHSCCNCLVETGEQTLIHTSKNCIIPYDGCVTAIGDYAFVGSEWLTEIYVPLGVEKIGDSAFSNCPNLTSIKISGTVEKIAYNALDWNNNVTIYGYNQSAAQDYARSRSIPFVQLEYQNGQWNLDSDGLWYYLGIEGELVSNVIVQDSKGWCFIGNDGYMEKDVWVFRFPNWNYYNRNGIITSDPVLRQNYGICYFDSDGYMVIDYWLHDGYGWCYFDEYGILTINRWVKDSQGWCYIGEDGYCVTNRWVKDSIGWCYLDENGRMATNRWIMDSQGWCYVGSDGYCVTNSWMKDSYGWCYLDENGRMATNRWIKDSQGWCYVGEDGYCVTNRWVKDSIGWCYLDENGRMVTNDWVMDSNGLCYIGPDGYCVEN